MDCAAVGSTYRLIPLEVMILNNPFFFLIVFASGVCYSNGNLRSAQSALCMPAMYNSSPTSSEPALTGSGKLGQVPFVTTPHVIPFVI